MALNRPECVDIIQRVKETFSGAGAFVPVEDPGYTSWGKIIIGWTFVVHGIGWSRRYGWATTEGFVFTELCGSRKNAEDIMRKVVADEEARQRRSE